MSSDIAAVPPGGRRPEQEGKDDALAGLKTLESETLGQRVHSELRTFLMEGGAQPGQKLTLRQLTEAFGTSPMPVREAVQRLTAEGALEILPNRSIRVPLMTKARFEEMRKVRIALEGLAVEEATRLVDDLALRRLESLNAAFTEEMQSGDNDPGRLFRANKEFHFTIYRAAQMPSVVLMIESLWLRIGPILHFSLGYRGREATRKFAPHHHTRMLQGLRHGDPEMVRAGLVSDIMDAGDLILRIGNLPD